MFFSHGSEHSKGVVILVKNSLEFELKSVRQDSQERFFLLEASTQKRLNFFVQA